MEQDRCTVNYILDQYEIECVPKLAQRTQKDYARHLRILRTHFGEMIAQDLVPRNFREFMNVKKGRIHRNRTIAVLSAAFTFAVQRLYILDKNVIRDVARHDSMPRDRLVTTEEFNSFYATVPPMIQIMMDLAVNLGQRQGDLLALKWSDIQPIGIVFCQQKTGKRLAVFVSPKVKRILGRAFLRNADKKGEHVIQNEAGLRYTPEGFRSMWQRYHRKWKSKPGNKAFTFHDLRARAATLCNSVEEAAALLGHTNPALTKRVYDRGIRTVQPPPDRNERLSVLIRPPGGGPDRLQAPEVPGEMAGQQLDQVLRERAWQGESAA